MSNDHKDAKGLGMKDAGIHAADSILPCEVKVTSELRCSIKPLHARTYLLC